MEEIKGTVERVNPKGLRVDGKWYNYSKYMEEVVPEVNEGDEVKIDIRGDWIIGLKLLFRQSLETLSKRENNHAEREKGEINWADRQVLIRCLTCLNTATEILKLYGKPITSKNLFKVAEELESWVWRYFMEEGREGARDYEFKEGELETEERN